MARETVNRRLSLGLLTNLATSDVRAWAWSPKPAQAGPGKPSRAQAVYSAWEGLGLRLQILKARAVGLSPIYIEIFYDR